jgi:hypothetical protein
VTVCVTGARGEVGQVSEMLATGKLRGQPPRITREVLEKLGRELLPIAGRRHDQPREHRVLFENVLTQIGGAQQPREVGVSCFGRVAGEPPLNARNVQLEDPDFHGFVHELSPERRLEQAGRVFGIERRARVRFSNPSRSLEQRGQPGDDERSNERARELGPGRILDARIASSRRGVAMGLSAANRRDPARRRVDDRTRTVARLREQRRELRFGECVET